MRTHRGETEYPNVAMAPAPVNFATFATFAKFITFTTIATSDWMVVPGDGVLSCGPWRLVQRYALPTSDVLFILGVCG